MAELDEQKPAVMEIQADPEMFHINDEKYVEFVHDPANADRNGYIATEQLITMDEVALRAEMPKPATAIPATSATTTILRWVERSAL